MKNEFDIDDNNSINVDNNLDCIRKFHTYFYRLQKFEKRMNLNSANSFLEKFNKTDSPIMEEIIDKIKWSNNLLVYSFELIKKHLKNITLSLGIEQNQSNYDGINSNKSYGYKHNFIENELKNTFTKEKKLIDSKKYRLIRKNKIF